MSDFTHEAELFRNDSNLFVFRPLATQSQRPVRQLQREYASHKTFDPIPDLHLTILGGESSYVPGTWDIHNLLTDGPQSATEPYEMEIEDAYMTERRRQFGKFSLILALKLGDGHFMSEHRKYMERAARRNKRDVAFSRRPHVTVGCIDAEFALPSALAPMQSLVGTTLSFDPLDSNFGKIVDRATYTAKRRPDVHSEVPPIDVAVQTIKPGSIPSHFLASLRTRGIQQE